MNNFYILELIAVASVATYLTRALPFWFLKNRKFGAKFTYIQKYMPLSIMIILVFYGVKDVDFALYPFGGFELLGIVFAIVVHVAFQNMLFSVLASTFF